MEEAALGKRVARSAYYHRDACARLPAALAEAVCTAETLAGSTAWNVAKLRPDEPKCVSLLTYEDFEEAFPALLESLTIDLTKGAVVHRSYRARVNPPVLHRKELLLPPDDPRRMRYGRLTADLERLGLLTGTAAIGTRLGWERRLREAGVVVIGHEVRDDSESEPPIEIKRHLAALRRAGLSTPIQALLRYGVIDAGATIFDYGCGRGSDVEGLRAAGVHASGWDRYFAPEAQKQGADVVNLGFVLNVIERPKERIEVLRDAFALARRCLAVAVITSSRARLDSCRPYGDGYVTRWGTFQKFYLPGELKAFVEDTLGRAAVPAGPGLFFVFRDSLAEQWFLATRQARSAPSPVTMLARRHLASDSRAEELRSELESIVARAYELGRIPVPDEVPQDVKPRLAKAKIGLAAALRLGAQLCDPEQLANARKSRVDGLRVYFALNLFNGRVAYKKLPERLQRVGRDGSHGGSADRQLRQSGDRRYHRH